MALTDVDICNRSLVSLGARTISSLTADGTDKSLAIATLYEHVKLMVLCMHDWRFSMAKEQLARLVDTPIGEWEYAYQLPSGMVSGPRAVFNTSGQGAEPFTEFEIFGDKLFTDALEIYIDFQQDVDEARMPPWFVSLLVLALAGMSGKLVTDSDGLVTNFLQRAFGPPSDNMRGGYFSVCVGINGKTNPPNAIQDNSLVNARFS